MVTLWLPTASDAMFSVAWPEASSAALPKLVAPSKKVTVAVGVPAAGATAVMVAVRAIVCPDTDGFTDAIRLLEAEPVDTASVRVALPLGLMLPLQLRPVFAPWL